MTYKISKITLWPIALMLKAPFRTAHNTTQERPLTIIAIDVQDMSSRITVTGYGEVQSFADCAYAPENQQLSRHLLAHHFIPALKAYQFSDIKAVTSYLQQITPFGSFARAGIEMALWDALGKLQHKSLAQMIGGINQQVPVGIAISLLSEPSQLLMQIKQAHAMGYERIKLKVDAKATDFDQIKWLLTQFKTQHFSLDANSSFTLTSAQSLSPLDAPNLDFIEQPFGVHDFVQHATFQRMSNIKLSLDESINALDDIHTSIALSANRVLTIKQGKIGGIQTAIEAIKLAQQHHVLPWIGGMLSSGLGRAVDLALASLPGIAFPGDISDSQRYFEQDIIHQRLTIHHGHIKVPTEYGIGITVDEAVIKQHLTATPQVFTS